MNCDQVFDILTRGPFPSGAASDAAVQRHLSGCAECRQLAEALRPALDLIHEAVPPEESWGLPGYWEDVPPGERPREQPVTVKQRPQLAVRRVRLPNEARTRRSAANERWRLAAIAAVAGALAAVAVLGIERISGERATGAGPATAVLTPIAWPPEKCEHETVAVATTAGQLAAELRSCRNCHDETPTPHWNKRPATVDVAATCLVCHEFVARE
ncbi:MAG: hypothetical protein DCC68_04130 [Planctomycetota bacterium]|nr:MAG: hypothetical protein DCC68_04130 [Planctomycetota bacterium]